MRSLCFVSALVLLGTLSSVGLAQHGLPAADIPELETSGRIALQQIDQLIAAQSWDAAVDELLRLADVSAGRLILLESATGETAGLQRWVPVRDYLNDRLLRWGLAAPEILARYRQRIDPSAATALQHARERKDFDLAERVVREFLATSHGDDALQLSADLAMDRGWAQRGRDALVRIDSRFQATGIGDNAVVVVPSAAWEHLLARYPGRAELIAAELQRTDRGLSFGSYRNSDLPLAEVASKIPYCSVLQRDIPRARRELELLQAMFPESNDSPPVATLQRSIANAAPAPMLAEIAPRFSKYPSWTTHLHSVDRDRTLDALGAASGAAGSRPRVYFPVVWNGRVFVHDINRIVGFDLQSGKPWPIDQPDVALFDTGQPPEELLPPAALPASGWPRFTLNIDRHRMVARLGPSVTGWLPVVRKPAASLSSVAVFDLSGEGRLLDAYPKTLESEELSGYEIEGTPLLVGDRIFCGITRRGGSLLTSRLACTDLRSGTLLWVSPELAVGQMASRRPANRVTHALVTYREGTLFYHANLGTVAAVDAGTGAIRWLVRYPRVADDENPFRDRPFVDDRDMLPVLLDAELAIVAPADCDRLIALDSATGQPLWTTDPGVSDDIVYLLGATAKHVIAAGQRLYWIDKFSGRVDAVYAAGSSATAASGSSLPRTAGRGVVEGNRIYWPTDDAILVLDAGLASTDVGRAVRVVDRIDLQACGLRGGNLLLHQGHLILAGPDRLAVFARGDFTVATIAPRGTIDETLKHE